MERADSGYVRRHRERWDITAALEPLQLLGAKTTEVNVHLHRSPPGRLAATIQFEREPASAPPMGCGQRTRPTSPTTAWQPGQ